MQEPFLSHRLRRTVLVIRLQRTGRRNFPAFRLVVAEKARPVKGKFIEILGHYLPTRDPVVFEFKQDRIEHWLGNGAIPSDTTARILTNAGVKGLEKYIAKYTKKKKRKAEEQKEEAPPDTKAAPHPEAKEVPAEETKVEEPAKEEEKKEEKPSKEGKEEPEKEKETVPAEEEADETPSEEGDKEEKKE